jgi:hypothetical protein
MSLRVVLIVCTSLLLLLPHTMDTCDVVIELSEPNPSTPTQPTRHAIIQPNVPAGDRDASSTSSPPPALPETDGHTTNDTHVEATTTNDTPTNNTSPPSSTDDKAVVASTTPNAVPPQHSWTAPREALVGEQAADTVETLPPDVYPFRTLGMNCYKCCLCQTARNYHEFCPVFCPSAVCVCVCAAMHSMGAVTDDDDDVDIGQQFCNFTCGARSTYACRSTWAVLAPIWLLLLLLIVLLEVSVVVLAFFVVLAVIGAVFLFFALALVGPGG